METNNKKTLIGYISLSKMDDKLIYAGFTWPVFIDSEKNFFFQQFNKKSVTIKDFEKADYELKYYQELPVEYQKEYSIGDFGVFVFEGGVEKILIAGQINMEMLNRIYSYCENKELEFTNQELNTLKEDYLTALDP